MNRIIRILFLLLIGLPLPGAAQQGNQRIRLNFNPGWKIYAGDVEGAEKETFNDASWKTVTLPHAFNEDDAFKVDIHNLSTGIAWYRKHFSVPASQKGQKIFLEFEGIRQGGDIYLNGEKLGYHENGVMAFGFDISDKIRFGTGNVLALRIDNSWQYKERQTGTLFQWNNNNFNANYGGIPKNVFLHVMGRIYQTLPLHSFLGTTGTYIYARNFDIPGKTATIVAESQVKNDFPTEKTIEFVVKIYDMNNRLVKTMTSSPTTIYSGGTTTIQVSDRVTGLNFWSWGYGYLYNVVTALIVNGEATDVVITRTGFRKKEFKNGMFYLNDRVLQVKGYAQRTSNEWPAMGISVPPWISDYSNRLMVEGNANLVRWMHVTPWKQDVESCDRVGLMQAMPAGDQEKDATGRQWEQRKELMRESIIYNRNSPSIIFYECGNESISEEHMQEMKNIRNEYDPFGGRAIGSREMLDSKVAEYGGEMLYINKSSNIPMWAMEYSRDEGLRKYWDDYSPPFHKDGDGPLYRNAPAQAYNRNQDSHAIEDVTRWFDYWLERPGTGKRVSSGGVNIIFSDSNTHYRGSENYRRSGEVDAMRLPKDGYWANQVMWDGWVDLDKFRTHIIGHWNYAPGTVKDINVVSGGDKVELFVNGISKGYGEQSKRFLFTFKNIAWEPGEIKAVSFNAQGAKLSEASHVTSGEPAQVKLTLHTSPEGFFADGADVVLVDVEVVDASGRRCPTANNLISFSVDGPADWRGGIAQGPDNYILSRQLPVECGVNRVMIRSTIKPGKINITATSQGLKAASLKVTAKPAPYTGGLSTRIPGATLPSYLDRGPTPAGSSVTITRIPVDIKSATAGANTDKVAASYDDNELSEWGNDGRISTGWIRYELAREATISEICVKMTGWRSRQYPISIMVGDKEVFQGTTEQTLGYVTLKVPPTRGKSVTIKLAGSNTEKDAFENIVEIGGTKELDLPALPNAGEAAGQLRIVEIEFYEPKP